MLRLCSHPSVFVLSVHLWPFLVKAKGNWTARRKKRTNYFRITFFFTTVFKLDQKNHICIVDVTIVRNMGLKWSRERMNEKLKKLNICQWVVLMLLDTDWEGPCRVKGPSQQLYLECLLADQLRCEETLLPGGSSVDIQPTTSSTFD